MVHLIFWLQTRFYIPTITLTFSILIKGNRTRLFFYFGLKQPLKSVSHVFIQIIVF